MLFRLRKSYLIVLGLVLLLPGLSAAAVLSGTVRDESGAVLSRTSVEISGAALSQPLKLVTDAAGKYVTPDLKPGSYTITVTREGFQTLTKSVSIASTDVTADLSLALAVVETEVTVAGKGPSAQYANADPVYRSLRAIGLGESFNVEQFTFKTDIGNFELRRGSLTFLAPVLGHVTGAIFVGDGHFQLKPFTPSERGSVLLYTGKDQVDEDFDEIVFRFTDTARRALLQGIKDRTTAPEAAAAFMRYEEKLRHRREEAQSMTEYLLHGEGMDNVDADVLASVYNPNHPFFFNAYIRGRKHKDLRFLLNNAGAVPQLLSPEEVALINFDPQGMEDGIWYLSHTLKEFQQGTSNSLEDKRTVAAQKFKIETVIGLNTHLASVATVTFEPLIDGERVIKLHLLPNLRVQRVTGAPDQKELFFIQEGRKADGSFYVILPEGAKKGQPQSVTVEYAGDKVVRSAGGGSFSVGARESWYPNLNVFNDRATYDLTYRVPSKYRLVSVGRLENEHEEDKLSVSHWISDQPIAVAGFNYGAYKKVTLPESKSGEKNPYLIEGYTLTELPDILRQHESQLPGLSPTSMTKYALEQTKAQLQVCEYYFGKNGFDRIYITEQPEMYFGQSWPTLVYLPITAYIDSTQRYLLFGGIKKGMSDFVREVTPHEVSHQWWGHAVGWATYHDQWLSEGFAEFSAALFLQNTQKNWQGDYIEFWNTQHKRILEKNGYGVSPNDAGPIWMGIRLDTPKSEGAYNSVVYPKGAYVLAMLRSMMWTSEDQDKAFIDMMHDFVESHRNHPASTESFKAVAEKHMPKKMDFQGNGRLDWFFNEWVYGTAVPKYQFDYQITPGEGGKFKLHMSLTQSEVGNDFSMLVPVFAEIDGRVVRFAQLPITGASTRTFDMDLPRAPKKITYNALRDILER
jgi:Peptidase family M1 domain/Carboxypeptidase regulatory-like domain